MYNLISVLLMIANPSKHQRMILGKTDYNLSFSTTDFIERFGVTLDKELKFKEHIYTLQKKKKIVSLTFSQNLVNSFPLGFCYGSIRHLYFPICLTVLCFGIFVKHKMQRN